MNRRFGTAPAHGTADTKRLAQWLVLVGVLVVIAYLSRIFGGKPSPQVLYQWSTFAGGLIQDAVILAVVLAISRNARSLLALRRPDDLRRVALYVVAAIVAVYLFESAYTLVVNPGNEQGLTPSHWEPPHAAAYIANAVVICTWVPLTEELTYRGLGYSLLAPLGRWPAVLAIGVIFGLAHGLVLSFPVLAAFGCVLAWIRSKTDSVYPGMVLHALFNAVALVAAVTIGS